MKLLRTLRAISKGLKEFPEGCKTGNELDWMLKGNCPACVADPFERISIADYRYKYPVWNTLTIGSVQLNLCDRHLEELCDKVEQMKMKG